MFSGRDRAVAKTCFYHLKSFPHIRSIHLQTAKAIAFLSSTEDLITLTVWRLQIQHIQVTACSLSSDLHRPSV